MRVWRAVKPLAAAQWPGEWVAAWNGAEFTFSSLGLLAAGGQLLPVCLVPGQGTPLRVPLSLRLPVAHH